MAKRFKLRLFRLIPSFRNCRSKDPSVLPVDPHPILFRFSPTTNKIDFPATPAALPVPDPPLPPPPPPPPPPKPYHSSLKRHVSSAIISVGCGLRSRSNKHHVSSSPSSSNSDSPEYKWKQNDKWHVIARVQDDPPPPPPPPPPRREIHTSSVSSGTDADISASPPLSDSKNNKRKKKKKSKPSRIRISTSSGDSGWFSSEGGEEHDGEETETLVSSSHSISTELETINESPTGSTHKKRKKKKKIKNQRRVRKLKRHSSSSPGTQTPPRLSVFQKLIPCTVDGKVRESFAVIKKSEDPYEDFKRSMLEMIVEKQMFEASELEQLLRCFISLNSRQHHGVIVEVFSEIWETLFGKSPRRTQLVLEAP